MGPSGTLGSVPEDDPLAYRLPKRNFAGSGPGKIPDNDSGEREGGSAGDNQ